MTITAFSCTLTYGALVHVAVSARVQRQVPLSEYPLPPPYIHKFYHGPKGLNNVMI